MISGVVPSVSSEAPSLHSPVGKHFIPSTQSPRWAPVPGCPNTVHPFWQTPLVLQSCFSGQLPLDVPFPLKPLTVQPVENENWKFLCKAVIESYKKSA